MNVTIIFEKDGKTVFDDQTFSQKDLDKVPSSFLPEFITGELIASVEVCLEKLQKSKPVSMYIADWAEKYAITGEDKGEPISLVQPRIKSFHGGKLLIISTPNVRNPSEGLYGMWMERYRGVSYKMAGWCKNHIDPVVHSSDDKPIGKITNITIGDTKIKADIILDKHSDQAKQILKGASATNEFAYWNGVEFQVDEYQEAKKGAVPNNPHPPKTPSMKIDLSPFVNSDIECRFSSLNALYYIGKLVKIERFAFCADNGQQWDFCQPRMNRWISLSGKGCPLPYGFIVDLRYRDGSVVPGVDSKSIHHSRWIHDNNNENLNDRTSEIIAVSIHSVDDGYHLPGQEPKS